MGKPWEALVEKARGRDKASIDALLEENLPVLRAYVRLRMGVALRAKESSCDLVQSVCREVLGDLGSFKVQDETSFRQWLFETALRKILDRRRYWTAQKRDAGEAHLPASETGAEGKLLECYSSFSAPNHQAEAHEEIERLERAFDQLSERDRRVIVLARIIGLSQAQIAAEIGCTKASVRNLLPRALARLSTLLGR